MIDQGPAKEFKLPVEAPSSNNYHTRKPLGAVDSGGVPPILAVPGLINAGSLIHSPKLHLTLYTCPLSIS